MVGWYLEVLYGHISHSNEPAYANNGPGGTAVAKFMKLISDNKLFILFTVCNGGKAHIHKLGRCFQADSQTNEEVDSRHGQGVFTPETQAT